MSRNLINTLTNIYYGRLPRRIRKIIGPLVEPAYPIVHRIYSIASDIYPPVTLLKEKGNSNIRNLSLCIARRGDVSTFFLNRMGLLEPKTTSQGRRLMWKITSIDRSRVNAVLIEADRWFSCFLSRRGFVSIPEWVLFTMDISMPVEEIFRRNKSVRSNLRKIRKSQYTYEVGSDREKFHYFYHKMYLPYIVTRFREVPLVTPFGYMEHLLQRGELLLVKKGSQYVSGVVIYTAPSIPIVALLGVTDGSIDYVKQGALSASYYYTIVWAKEKGYTMLDFGHCRPILNDGTFFYKKRLGMNIQRSPRKHRMLYLSVSNLNPYLERFLINSPLVYEEQGELHGLLFFERNAWPTGEEIEMLKRRHFIPGLKGFTVLSTESIRHTCPFK